MALTLDQIRAQWPDLKSMDDAGAVNAIRRVYYPHMSNEEIAAKVGVKLPPPPAPERTWGEAFKDTGAALLGGGAGLVKGAGDLYGLATGDMDNLASRLGGDAQQYWDEAKSDALRAKMQQRKENIDAEDSTLGKAWVAARDTLTDPALAMDTLAQNAATLLPGMGAGRLAAGAHSARALAAASSAGPVSAAARHAIAAKAGSIGTGTAIGVGGLQQGADVAGDIYQEMLKKPAEVWDNNPDFAQALERNGGDRDAAMREMATSVARTAFGPAFGISVAANMLPGASYLERALVGGAARKTIGEGVKYALPKAIAKGVIGEGAQEFIEEGGGKLVANLAARGKVDPSHDPWQDVGENAGMGFAGGAMMGGAGGAFNAGQRQQEQKPIEERGPLSRAANAGLTSGLPIVPANETEVTDDPTAVAPEPASDVQAQINAIRDPSSAKDAALVTPNTSPEGLDMDGLIQVPTHRGLLVTSDPGKAAAARQMADTITDEQMAGLLGYGAPKAESDGTVVQAVDSAGNVVHDEATSLDQIDDAMARAADMAPDGGGVGVTDVNEGLARRAALVDFESAEPSDQELYNRHFADSADPEYDGYVSEALDADIPWGDVDSNVSTEEFLRSLGATDKEIKDAITANQSRGPQGGAAPDGQAQGDVAGPTGADAGAVAQGAGEQVQAEAVTPPVAQEPQDGATDDVRPSVAGNNRGGRADAGTGVAAGLEVGNRAAASTDAAGGAGVQPVAVAPDRTGAQADGAVDHAAAWDGMDADERATVLTQEGGWPTAKGGLNRIGQRLAKMDWDKLAEGTRQTVASLIDKRRAESAAPAQPEPMVAPKPTEPVQSEAAALQAKQQAGVAKDEHGFISGPDETRTRVSQHRRGSSVLAPTADIGAIIYETRRGENDRRPLDMVVSKDGKLVQTSVAASQDESGTQVSTGVAWVPSNQAVANKVVALLEQRATTKLGSKERAAINAEIEATVLGDRGLAAAPAKAGAEPVLQNRDRATKASIDAAAAILGAGKTEPTKPAKAAAKPKAAKKPSAEQTRAKADLMNALADLADIATKHQRAAIVPESTPDLMPTLVRLFDAAIRIVGTDVRQATRWVQEQLRANPATKKLVNRIEPQTYRKAAEQAVAAAGDVQDGLFASTAEADAVLSTYTESDLKARDAAKETAQREQDSKKQDDERRAQADAERGEFTLTGSDRAVDVAEAHGQQTMFSRARTPAQPRNLVTLHNLTVDNLLHADSTGGLPVPSLGITKVDSPFGGFGNITLIGPRGMIDPEAGVPVFDRDAYTGRFPEMNYKRPKVSEANSLYERMHVVREQGGTDGMAGDAKGFVSELWDVVRNRRDSSPSKVADLFDKYMAPRMLYAQEVLGKTIKTPMRAVPLESELVNYKPLRDFLLKNKNALDLKDGVTQEQHDAARAQLAVEVGAAIEGYDWGRDADGNPGLLKFLRDNARDSNLNNDGSILVSSMNRMLRSVSKYGQREVDISKMRDVLNRIVKRDDPGYVAWVNQLIDPLFEPPTITLRGREVEPTLDNLVAAMTIGQTAGAEKTMTSGTGKTAAMLGKRFKSIAEIQAARDQVVSEATENEAKKTNEQVLSEYQNAVLPFFKYKNWKGEVDTWAGLDAAMEALADAGKRGSTDAAIRKALSKQGFTGVDQATVNLARQSIDALRNTPTNYFEAKPQRAVGLDEFRGAVVPRGTDPRALEVLAKHGIEVVEHGKGDGARDKAIASLSKKLDKAGGDVLFSRAVEGDGIEQATRAEVERWQKRLLDAESNPQAKEPSMATPAVLRVMGAKAANLTLPRTYLKAIQKTHPDVPRSVFSELPALLADPLFIIPRKDGGLRVFVDAATAKGEPIFAGISIDDSGRINTVSPLHDWNGKTGSEILGQTLENALDRQGKIYARNKEALDGSRASTAAAPAILALHRGVSHRVTRSRASVITRDQVVKMIADGKKHGTPKYSLSGDAASAAQSVAAVEQHVKVITAKWQNAPDVVVVASMQDPKVHQRVRDHDAEQKSLGATGEPEGFLYGGKVYVVASQLRTVDDVARVMMHESLGHYGLRGVFGDALVGILNQIGTVRRGEVVAKAVQYGMVPKTVPEDASVGEKWAAMTPQQRLQAAEEVLAEMAQTRPEIGFVKRALAAIRTWLRANVPALARLRMTDAEIVSNFILPARAWVERGKQPQSEATQAALAVDPVVAAFSRNQADKSRFSAQDAYAIVEGQEDSAIPDGWFVHGRSRSTKLSLDWPIQMTQRAEVAGQYAGSEGSVWALKPKRGAKVLVFGYESNDMNTFVQALRPLYESERHPVREWAEAAELDSFEALEEAVRNDFAPDRIVDSAGAFDDPGGMMNLLEYYPGGWPTMVETPDGAVVIPGMIDSMETVNLTDLAREAEPENGPAMFSRADALRNPSELRGKAVQTINDLFRHTGTVSWWHKTVGTMHNLARRSPQFRRVFDGVQQFMGDVSAYATEAADLAPRLLPKLETWRDIGKSPISAEDTKAISAPIFEGTLTWARDHAGNLVKIDELEQRYANFTTDEKKSMLLRMRRLSPEQVQSWLNLPPESYEGAIRNRFEREFLRAGTVFTDAELRTTFNLSDSQIGLYREFRAATDKSLDKLAITEMLRFGGEDVADVRAMALETGDADQVATLLADHLRGLADDQPDRASVLMDTADKIAEKAARIKDLKDRGYAPLSRFGQYTLDVLDESGERVYFGMFETKLEANRMARRMRENYPDGSITQGTVSEQAYKLFSGMTPETLELFGEMVGLEQTGDEAKDQMFQEYLKLAKANRSAMKRLIHRKGIAGFSEDAGRVLAGFIYSNARLSSTNLHTGAISRAVADIPKSQGELKDMAIKLADYIRNPQEEAQAIRGLMFTQYLGGSLASAFVNMTQPIAVTMPYLSQWGGARKAAARMRGALADVLKKSTGDARLDEALKQAEAEGIVAPQEVHHLLAQSRGAATLASGDGTIKGDLFAKAMNAKSKLSLAWGKPFSAAEQFNRRVTFIAAWRTAVAEGIANPAKFAAEAINDTQFIYNKGNRPQWARGAIGATLFTFKSYSISYVELMHRLATQGGPEGKKAALFMLAMMFLMGGAGGLPFMEDAEDVVDGVLQRLGYSFSTKQARKQWMIDTLGKDAAEFVESGISGLPGVPIDVAGRLGLGNLVPGTGLLTKRQSYGREVAEIAGPAGDFIKRTLVGVDRATSGDVVGGAMEVMPTAVRNLTKGVDMYSTGMYRDSRGRKVVDVDGYEAFIKAAGFQPRAVSEVQEGTSAQQYLIGQNKLMKAQLAERMASAVFERDPAKQQAVREQVSAWNQRNPSSPIKIDMQAVRRRVADMRRSKAERVQRSAPKAIRADVRQALMEDA